jgi:hypothetical protein
MTDAFEKIVAKATKKVMENKSLGMGISDFFAQKKQVDKSNRAY